MAAQGTLASRVAQAIREDYLASGTLREGDRLPTVVELQGRYRTSSNTIVQALGVLEARGLLRKRRGSGCFVSERAEEQATPASLAFIHPAAAGAELLMRALQGVQRVCARAGCQLVLGGFHGYEQERAEVQRVVDAGCRAVVLYPATRTRDQLASDYLARELADAPIVLLDIAHPDQRRPQVVFDNYRAGYDMTRLLITRGHRRIAFMDMGVAPDEWMHRSTRDRHRAYLDALAESGLRPHPEDRWVVGPASREPLDAGVARYLTTWKAGAHRPTALLALEDSAAVTTIGIARELGVRVPGELEVVGFDDREAGRAFHPRFATTQPDFVRAGELAAELALQCAQGCVAPHFTYMLPVPVLDREAVCLENTLDVTAGAYTANGTTEGEVAASARAVPLQR